MPTLLQLAVILNLKSFGLAVLAVLVLLIAASVMYRHPTRQCHHCGKRVKLSSRICSNCGYDFDPVRMTR